MLKSQSRRSWAWWNAQNSPLVAARPQSTRQHFFSVSVRTLRLKYERERASVGASGGDLPPPWVQQRPWRLGGCVHQPTRHVTEESSGSRCVVSGASSGTESGGSCGRWSGLVSVRVLTVGDRSSLRLARLIFSARWSRVRGERRVSTPPARISGLVKTGRMGTASGGRNAVASLLLFVLTALGRAYGAWRCSGCVVGVRCRGVSVLLCSWRRDVSIVPLDQHRSDVPSAV
jgi:hypothetical protein